jgi:hypothetical protein
VASPVPVAAGGALTSEARSVSTVAAVDVTSEEMRGRIVSGSSAMPKRSRRVAATVHDTASGSSPGATRILKRARPVSPETIEAVTIPGTEERARSSSS